MQMPVISQTGSMVLANEITRYSSDRIVAYVNGCSDDGTIIGVYKTEERRNGVLKEMNSHFSENPIMHEITREIHSNQTVEKETRIWFYVMPKE